MAGKVNIDEVILGDSLTPGNNFVLKTNTDGTSGLYRNADGSGGEIIGVDGTSGVHVQLGLHIPQGEIISGIHTPTLTNTTNISSSTAFVNQYMRVGSVVTVSGQVTITPTAAANALTVLDMSLPVSSVFDSTQQAGGTGVCLGTITNTPMSINAVIGSLVRLSFYAGEVTARTWKFSFTYRIV